jgi:hypothetical protein
LGGATPLLSMVDRTIRISALKSVVWGWLQHFSFKFGEYSCLNIAKSSTSEL